MKIALLTLTPKNNYGGILQASALYTYLERKGHDVTLINKIYYKNPFKRFLIYLLERLPLQNIKEKKSNFIKEKKLKPFITKHIKKISRKIVNSDDFQSLIDSENFDAIIVGSDQVWRYQYINDGNYKIYFLNFNSKTPIKRISYAASFGKDKWEAEEEIPHIKKLLQDFQSISVRENSGVRICRDTFGINNSVNVLDPTMLIGIDFYNKIIPKNKNKIKNRIITSYILDQNSEKEKTVSTSKIILEKDKSTYQVISIAGSKYNYFTVEEWLWHIKNSDFIITDSFHGMVFSIIFEKQFLVIGNPTRGLSRFLDLLSILNLDQRLLQNNEYSQIESIIESSIDYSSIREKINSLRRYSEDFILNSLND